MQLLSGNECKIEGRMRRHRAFSRYVLFRMYLGNFSASPSPPFRWCRNQCSAGNPAESCALRKVRASRSRSITR